MYRALSDEEIQAPPSYIKISAEEFIQELENSETWKKWSSIMNEEYDEPSKSGWGSDHSHRWGDATCDFRDYGLRKLFSGKLLSSSVGRPKDPGPSALTSNSPMDSMTDTESEIILTPSTTPTSSRSHSRSGSVLERAQDQASSVKHPLSMRVYHVEALEEKWSRGSRIDSASKKQPHAQRRNLDPNSAAQQISRLQSFLKMVERDYQRANADLHNQRQLAEELLEENRELRKEHCRALQGEMATSSDLQTEVTKLKILADQQAYTIEQQLSEIAKLESNCKRLEGEVTTRSAQIYTLQGQNSDLCTQRNNIKISNEAAIAGLSAQLAICRTRSMTPSTELKKLQRDDDELTRKLEPQADLAASIAENLKNDQIIAELKAKVSLLEQDRDLKDPLVKIGAETRLRNLEHARERVSGITKKDIDWEIIEKGNRAAHRASAEIDAALFKARLVPTAYLATAKETYESLYQITPAEYPKFSPKGHRLVDCKASMRILLPLNQTNSSSKQRAEWKEVEGKLYSSYTNPMSITNFEASPDTERKLVKLESLTNEIIQLDRSRNGRRRG